MTDRPTLSEVTALIRELKELIVDGVGDPAEVMDHKADLFERTALHDPGMPGIADVARDARTYADRLNGRLP
ncbi:hypothetical protein [Yinghuangia soli]|uniref:Uncharacterized protein n=1 Tax=Yinghuangia soli TaxID=2908204 RepID=A0AA41Q623_9ACTN|nr:hypothetical protein [Yinghuangia soli]MCF2531321.1 hypothetical protein [Yinghuangia soli]